MTWLLSKIEAGDDLALIQTPLPFICKAVVRSLTGSSLPEKKHGGLYQNKVTSGLVSTKAFQNFVSAF